MTPDHIQEQTFKKSLRGYEPAAVHAFLDELADGVRSLVQQNEVLRARLALLESKQKDSEAVEERLRAVLAGLEGTADALLEQSRNNAAAATERTEQERTRLVAHAREEAALITRDAERTARRLVDEAQAKRDRVLEEVELLSARRAALVARMKSIMAAQLEFLQSLERDARDSVADTPEVPGALSKPEGLSAARLHTILSTIDAGDPRRQ
ncbi:MAG: DivIVA domain-containing protein [Ignavibacteriae bacterium]|nr:DivIVA domain-containing protein [Ignavibacteriota bacterium]